MCSECLICVCILCNLILNFVLVCACTVSFIFLFFCNSTFIFYVGAIIFFLFNVGCKSSVSVLSVHICVYVLNTKLKYVFLVCCLSMYVCVIL